MELLLNLFWLALALPAAWLLKNKTLAVQGSPRISRFRPFILLACVLTLLFPVVSASDDLHAMRPEIEESAGKRVGRQVQAHRPAGWRIGAGSVPLLSVFPVLLRPADKILGPITTSDFLLPEPAQISPRPSRGPPSIYVA